MGHKEFKDYKVPLVHPAQPVQQDFPLLVQQVPQAHKDSQEKLVLRGPPGYLDLMVLLAPQVQQERPVQLDQQVPLVPQVLLVH